MTDDALFPAEEAALTDEQQTVRLVVLGDPAGAPVCDGDACHVPPPPAAERTAPVVAADHPQ